MLKISPSTQQIQLILINSLRDFCVSHVKTKQTLRLLGCHGNGLGPVPAAPSTFWSQQWKEVSVSPQQLLQRVTSVSVSMATCRHPAPAVKADAVLLFQQCVHPVQTAGGGSGPAVTCLMIPNIPPTGGLGRAVGEDAKSFWQIWW